MKTFYAIFLALLIAGFANAQSVVEKQIESKRKELRLAGIDTTVVYYRYANGSMPVVVSEDTVCHTYEVKYLFWSRGSQTFVQRFDNCKQHQAILVASTFIRTIKSNYRKLLTEKVLPPEYTYWEKGEKIGMTQSASHSTFTIFEITAGTGTIHKSIDHADLGVNYLDGKHKNINYQHNLNTVQYKLKVLAEDILKKIEGNL